MKKLILLLPLIFLQDAYCQFKFEENLNGFKLGQFRECPKNEFGRIFMSDKYEDGMEYEVFLLKPDTSLYMAFEYSKQNPQVIWSIQIYGKNYDPNFLSLKLGMNSNEIEKILGKPDSIIDIGKYGKRWEFNKSNYSIEITPNGHLSSIKIMDRHFSTTGPDVSKMLSLSDFQAILLKRDNRALSKILAPDLELYYNENVCSFKYSFDNEIIQDKSNIYSRIFNNSKDVLKITEQDTLDYTESIRVSIGIDSMWVFKFSNKHRIEEIVFKYQFERYLIWEISLRKN
jgi:hypothetical protein